MEVVVFFDCFEFFEAFEAVTDGAEVGEGSAEPSFDDIVHAYIGDALFDDAFCLAFGAYEADIFSACDGVCDVFSCKEEAFDGFLDVDDVDPVSFAVDVRGHFGVPST